MKAGEWLRPTHHDRETDAENLRVGLRTVRITRERIQHTSDREAARLQRILDQDSAF